MLPREKNYVILLFSILLLTVFIIIWSRKTCSENYNKKTLDNKILVILMDDVVDEMPDKTKYDFDIIEFNQMFEIDKEAEEINDIVNSISKKYKSYDSFIIIRKSDKLTYTASLLSFLLENVNKPVVVSDDIKKSVSFASQINIPEVTVLYDDKIIRGCRAKDIGIDIISIDYPYLAEKIEDDYVVDNNSLLSQNNDKFKPLNIDKSKKISLIKCYPDNNILLGGSDVYIIEGFIDPKSDILKNIKELVEDKGATVINVDGQQNELVEKYVISSDLSPETAYAKALFIVSNVPNCDREMMRQLFDISMRGE